MSRIIEVTLYKFSELSEKAKEKAWEHWLGDGWEFSWSSEYEKTLKEFEDRFPIKVTDWEISTCSHSYATMCFTDDNGLEAISGVRLMAHLYTHHFHDLFKGKYYSVWSKTHQNKHWREGGHAPWGDLKSRHSKVMFEPNMGSLSGFCADEDILDPIYEFLKKPYDITYAKLMQECLDSWVEAYQDDMEACSTLEYFSEEANNNDYEFTENGERA